MAITNKVLSLCFVFLLLSSFSNNDNISLQTIENILKLPEKNIDITVAKLSIDKLIDPSINIANEVKKINNIYDEILKYQGHNNVDINTIRRYLYQPGEWNNFTIYKYDVKNALKPILRTALLSNYIKTKKGNCITMPVLFYILSHKAGYNLTMSKAPNHLFIQGVHENGSIMNIEPTDRAVLYSRNKLINIFSISNIALENKVYLSPLNKKESVSILLNTLTSFHFKNKDYKKALKTCKLAIKYYPNNAKGYGVLGIIYSRMKNEEINQVSNSNTQKEKQNKINHLLLNARLAFEKAKSLGWKLQSDESRDKYFKNVKKIQKAINERKRNDYKK